MSFLGEYQLGDLVPLSLVTVDADDTPTLPDAAPQADIYSGSALVASVKLPVVDLTRRVFGLRLPLSSAFAAGSYDVAFRWLLSATENGATARFEVRAGGHAEGSVIGLSYFQPNLERPAVVFQTDGGFVGAYRNPRVE